jgi:hypothetical protein
MAAPVRGASTEENKLHITFDELTGTATGGSTILSYIVAWNAGDGDTFVNIIGDSEANLLTSVFIEDGVTSGSDYRIKVFARNAHGDGTESAELTIYAATVPSQMNAASVSVISAHDSLKYRVTIQEPHSGGTDITIDSYELLFRQSDGVFTAVAECPGTGDLLTL